MAQPFAAHPSPERGRFVNAALVGALHLGVIYTLLVGLELVPNPIAPPPPTHIKIIDQHLPKAPPISVTDNGPTLRHPTLPQEPVAPVIHTQESANTPGGAATESATRPITGIPSGPHETTPVRGTLSTHTTPPYPPLAIRIGYEGSVRLRIAVDERGAVAAAFIEASSGHPDLDAAAVAWVKSHWRYEPAMQDGQPASAVTSATVVFKLDHAR